MKQIGIIFGALLGFLVITIWVPIQTHIAMQNAFAYKKGKSRRKKENAHLDAKAMYASTAEAI